MGYPWVSEMSCNGLIPFTKSPARSALFALAFTLGAGSALATSPEQVTVERDGDAYRVRMSVELAAPADRIRSLLTDYAHLERINPAVVGSEVLGEPAPGVTRVRTRIKSCVWFFCRQIELVEDLHTAPDGVLKARIVAELSDMRAGSADWEIRAAGDRTRLTYTSTMEPAFWVPPLIGPRAIVKNLRRNLARTADNLERLAAEGGRFNSPARSAAP